MIVATSEIEKHRLEWIADIGVWLLSDFLFQLPFELFV